MTSQAEQYADAAVGHVADLLHNLASHLDAGHGVSVNASGHTENGQFSLTANGRALPAPVAQDAPAQPA